MSKPPLKAFETVDPELLKLLGNNREFALAEGALPRKFKLLIAMALDAALGAVDGVTSLAQQAMEAGATREEIAEALRVAHYISGARSVYTAGRGLNELF